MSIAEPVAAAAVTKNPATSTPAGAATGRWNAASTTASPKVATPLASSSDSAATTAVPAWKRQIQEREEAKRKEKEAGEAAILAAAEAAVRLHAFDW